MSDLKAVVIGASGNMGREHVAAYKSCGVEVVEKFTDGPHIVSIAAPDSVHGFWVKVMLSQGFSVFCEKPLATTLEDLEDIKAASRTGHLAQNFPLRHHPDFQRLKSGNFAVGDIYRIDAVYNLGRSYKLKEGWRSKGDYSLVMGGLIHMVDIVLWATGLDMVPVAAIGTNLSTGFINHDTVTAICPLRNGGVATFTVDGGTAVKEHSHFLRIHSNKGERVVRNFVSTDKHACIVEFVNHIRAGKPPARDFRATEICLDIERLASTSAAP